MSDLNIELKYDVTKNTLNIWSNIKRDRVEDILTTFIRTQIGKGEDKREANKLEEYRILIELDLSYDIFNITDNCGNKGLRDGIIIHYMTNRKSWEWEE
jgi:hypothetical protein